MGFLRLKWRQQEVTFNRPSTVQRDGLERPGPASGTSSSGLKDAKVLCSVRQITASLQRGRPGTTLRLGLRAYTEDAETALRRGDRATLQWPHPGPGETVNLLVDSVTPYRRHRQIDLVDVLEGGR